MDKQSIIAINKEAELLNQQRQSAIARQEVARENFNKNVALIKQQFGIDVTAENFEQVYAQVMTEKEAEFNALKQQVEEIKSGAYKTKMEVKETVHAKVAEDEKPESSQVQQPEQQPIQQSVQQPATEPVHNVQQPVQANPFEGLAQQPVQQPVQQTNPFEGLAQQPVQQPMQQPQQSPLAQPVQQTAQQSQVDNPFQGITQQPVQQPMQQPTQQAEPANPFQGIAQQPVQPTGQTANPFQAIAQQPQQPQGGTQNPFDGNAQPNTLATQTGAVQQHINLPNTAVGETPLTKDVFNQNGGDTGATIEKKSTTQIDTSSLMNMQQQVDNSNIPEDAQKDLEKPFDTIVNSSGGIFYD